MLCVQAMQILFVQSSCTYILLQYNWGYPAALKNAIDYLYHEWKGKPAAIISYGGHGGGKAASQLAQVRHCSAIDVPMQHPCYSSA